LKRRTYRLELDIYGLNDANQNTSFIKDMKVGTTMENRPTGVNIFSIGTVLMYIYVFMSFTALDIVISSRWTTVTLYAFLTWGIFTALVIALKEGRFYFSAYSLWYFLFLIASLIIMLYSREKSLLTGQFYFMLVTLCLTYVIQMFINDENAFRKLCWAYSISSFALVAILFFTGNLKGTSQSRLGAEIMSGANVFATVMMVAVMFELWLVVYDAKKIGVRLILASMIAANMYSLILSAGRKFFVVPFIFLYILFLFKADKNGRKHIIRYTIFIILLLFIAYNLIMRVPVFYQALGYRMESYINALFGAGTGGDSAEIREKMRVLGLREWVKSPVWGYGFDSFKFYARYAVGRFFYSHCNYVELLYNGGILYFLLYYWIYLKIIMEAFLKKSAQLKYKAFAVAVAVGFLVFDYGAVSYSVTILHIMLAMAIKVLSFEKESEKVGVIYKQEQNPYVLDERGPGYNHAYL